MKVQELLDLLGDFDPDAEVRLAQQPSWPFAYSIGEVVEDEGHQHEPDVAYGDHDPIWYCTTPDCGVEWDAEPMDSDLGPDGEDGTGNVYIGEGTQLGYLPGSAGAALGWGR